ncbi:MAG: hypothetical protein WAN36_17090, partial [Calditrichia bacterium]
MKFKLKNSVYILTGLLLLLSCQGDTTSPEFEQTLTVFGYLWGNRPLDAAHAVLIARTRPIFDYYNLEEAAVRNALVVITEESSGRKFKLQDTAGRPGFYFNDSLIIKPKETYRLQVEAAGITITAQTTVPPVLQLTTELRADTVNAFFNKTISRTKPVFMDCEDIDQIILVDMYCNETWENAEYITPFFGQDKPQNREEYDGGRDGEPRHIRGMARLREMVSDNFPGRYVVDWYSSMLVFYGSYT